MACHHRPVAAGPGHRRSRHRARWPRPKYEDGLSGWIPASHAPGISAVSADSEQDQPPRSRATTRTYHGRTDFRHRPPGQR